MTESRISSIQNWVEDILKAENSQNTTVLLGMALAHINELLEEVSKLNKNLLANRVTETKTHLEDYLKKHPIPSVDTPPTNPFVRQPYTIKYDNNVNEKNINQTPTREQLDFLFKGKYDVSADMISDELVEKVAADTSSVEKVLKRVSNDSEQSNETVEQVDATAFNSTEPTKLETMLAEHFIPNDNVFTSVKIGVSPYENTVTKIHKVDHTETSESKVNNEIFDEFKASEKSKIEKHNTKVDALEAADKLVNEHIIEDAFVNKYGGKIATIDVPFDGTMEMAPGITEEGYIDDTKVPYHNMSEASKQIFHYKLAEQNKEDNETNETK